MADLDPMDLTPDEQPAEAGVSARGPSVRLRTGADQAGMVSSRMDPANQSLADALRFTYGLLKVVMVALALLFVFSGIKTIQEGERGISVFFGRPTALNLPPGLQFTWPYPIGEMIRVGEGTVEAKIGRAFMPYSSSRQTEDEAMAAKVDDFTTDSKLKPGRAGSNITSDLNIAHTQWTVNYRRTDHERWAENMLPQQEDAIVRAAIQRGVVQAVAGVTIDALLKQSGDSISARVREIAQQTLAGYGLGAVFFGIAAAVTCLRIIRRIAEKPPAEPPPPAGIQVSPAANSPFTSGKGAT